MATVELSPIRVDAERARAYVLAHGAARDVARMEGIFGAVGPAREVVRGLEELQNPDGGFAARQVAGSPSSINTTCFLLFQMRDLPPLSGSPMASRAVAYLRRVQQPDGSWMESDEALRVGHGWQEPKYLTALALYTILAHEPEHMDPINRGAGWLRRALASDSTGAATPTQTLILTWTTFYRLFGQDSHEAAWAFQTLLHRDRDAAERAWGLACALEVGAGGKWVLRVARLLTELAALQREDGSWPGEEGFELEATLTALRVFRGYGVI
ncbi:MAG TPA: prenyltransferase/squalene oxidase repeat-containing protein [Symbiobacteriaceae bacterium]|nr:prenyltransferase/squalene oxidase repeat-containing protein [Symbiobacteriaceae bacterium]